MSRSRKLHLGHNTNVVRLNYTKRNQNRSREIDLGQPDGRRGTERHETFCFQVTNTPLGTSSRVVFRCNCIGRYLCKSRNLDLGYYHGYGVIWFHMTSRVQVEKTRPWSLWWQQCRVKTHTATTLRVTRQAEIRLAELDAKKSITTH